MKSLRLMPTTSQGQSISEEAEALKERYVSPSKLLEVYGIEVQLTFQSGNYSLEGVSFCDEFPTMVAFEQAFGKKAVMYWLKMQFGNFMQMWSPKKEQNEELLTQLASIILGQSQTMNMGEICLFIAWLNMGKFKNLYDGSPVRISTCFQQFADMRRQARMERNQRLEREEKERQEQEDFKYRHSRAFLEDQYAYWRETDNEEMKMLWKNRLIEFDKNNNE